MNLSWQGRPIAGAVLDVDGTLTDSIDLYFEVFREVTARVGVPVLREDVLEPMSTGSLIWDRAIPADLPERAEKVSQCMREIPAVFERRFQEAQLLPGVAAVLRFLRQQGVALGIVTSSWRPALAPLRREGLLDLFQAVVTYEDGFAQKPSPDGMLDCLRRLGVAPAEAIVVGDSPLDLQAGRACGSVTVGVLSGIGSREQMEAEEPDALLDSIVELPTVLGRALEH